MNKLFQIKDLEFYEEDFMEDIKEYEDIIEIVQELQDELTYEVIHIAGDNICCSNTKKNYLVEIVGYVDENDEFVTKKERDAMGFLADNKQFDLFVITIHKCMSCGRWIISILE